MKKLIPFLLILAMFFALLIPVSAEETPITVPTGDRMPFANVKRNVTEADASFFPTAISPAAKGSAYNTNGKSSLAFAQDGDYLYLLVNAEYNYAERKTGSEVFVFLDYNTNDSVDQKIFIRENYGQYILGKTNSTFYVDGYADRTNDGSSKIIAPYMVSVNGESPLSHYIYSARNSGTPAEGGTAFHTMYVLSIPLPEDLRAQLNSGEDVTIGAGFVYMQAISANGYTTSLAAMPDGFSSLSQPADFYNFIYNSTFTEDNLTRVTLKGKAQESSWSIYGVQKSAVATDTFSLRLVGILNSPSLAEETIGVTLTAGDNSVTRTCGYAYSSINASNDGGEQIRYDAWQLGADYISTVTVVGFKVGTAYEFTVTPFRVVNGERVNGNAVVIHVGEDGSVS